MIVFLICILYGLYTITLIEKFDIQNQKNCTANFDFCSTETLSYLGKYHVGYKFEMDNLVYIFPILYFVLMFIPNFFTSTKLLGAIWGFFVILINSVSYIFGIRDGEQAAMWCFLSILYFLPLSLFNKSVFKFLNK